MDDRDRAVIARIGGNLYRESDADRIARRHPLTSDAYIKHDAESLAAGDSYRRGAYSQPYHSASGEWDDPATYHGQTHFMIRRPDSRATLPEAAFDWPIYRAGIAARLAQRGDCPSAYPDGCPDLDTCPVHDRGDLFAPHGE